MNRRILSLLLLCLLAFGQALGAVAVDGSTPARVSGTPNATGSLVTGSFTAPTDAFLVAVLTAEVSSSLTTHTLTDSGGLTWTSRVERTYLEALAEHHVQMWTARTTSSAARTVTLQRNGTDGGNGQRAMSLKVYVFTGVDVNGTPFDTVDANNKGGSTTNSISTTSITAGAAGMLLVAGINQGASGDSASSDLTIDPASMTGQSTGVTHAVISGYKAVSSGASVSGNIDAAGTGASNHDWIQIIVRQAAGGGGGTGIILKRRRH